jgi:hypothetical protein
VSGGGALGGAEDGFVGPSSAFGASFVSGALVAVSLVEIDGADDPIAPGGGPIGASSSVVEGVVVELFSHLSNS